MRTTGGVPLKNMIQLEDSRCEREGTPFPSPRTPRPRRIVAISWTLSSLDPVL